MNPINTIIEHGFKRPEEITIDHYILGGGMVPQDILQVDGQWTKFIPITEKQYNDFFDTYGCTTFGTLNCIEIMKNKLSSEENYADRWTYVTSNTTPPGNDPHIVAESIRAMGLIQEDLLPFDQSIDSLDKFREIGNDDTLVLHGNEWLDSFNFKHEWVFLPGVTLNAKQAMLLEALKYSPVGVSVRAWQQRENGLYYKNPGEQDTHWCALVGYIEGLHWIIFDSYPNSDGSEIKLLEWDYDFGFAKRYHLSPKFKTQLSLIEQIINWIKKFLKIK